MGLLMDKWGYKPCFHGVKFFWVPTGFPGRNFFWELILSKVFDFTGKGFIFKKKSLKAKCIGRVLGGALIKFDSYLGGETSNIFLLSPLFGEDFQN